MTTFNMPKRAAKEIESNQASGAPRAAVGGAEDLSWARSLAGRFIVFEGPDGSGKSTQFERLVRALAAQRVPHIPVREPGGTRVGEAIRHVLLDTANTGMGVRCEMLLYMASRAELVEQCIIPALRRGEAVLADRFVSSTLAYQGAAGGIPMSDISAVARVATRGLVPDLIVVFDLDADAAARRLSPLLDRMEAKGAAFHKRVREGYLEQVKHDPGRYVKVDAGRSPDEVWAELVAAMKERAPHFGPRRRFDGEAAGGGGGGGEV